jgi:rod shape-determining protein MreD
MIVQTLLIIAVFIFQTGFPALLKFGGVFPDLVLAAIIVISFANPARKVVVPAIAGGLLVDIFSGMTLGISVILFLAIVFIINAAKKFLFANFNFSAILVAVFGITIFSDIFYFLSARILGWLGFKTFFVETKYLFFSVLPKEILYNLIAAAALYLLWILAKFLTGYRKSWK